MAGVFPLLIVMKPLASSSVAPAPLAPTVTGRAGRNETGAGWEGNGGAMHGKDCSQERGLPASRVATCLDGSGLATRRLVGCGATPAAVRYPFCVSKDAAEQYVHEAETPGPGT